MESNNSSTATNRQEIGGYSDDYETKQQCRCRGLGTDTPAPTSRRQASTPVNLSLPSLSDISFSGLTSLLQDADETTNH